MSSSVFFKFKSQKEPTRVEFDGTGISVFELKREIISKSGLGDGTDFDLFIYTDDGSEEYDDDTTIVPRSTTVVARRQPAIKPGAGRAARYVSGKMPVTAKNAGRKEQGPKASAAKAANVAISQMNDAMTEEDRMAAMFTAQSEQWSAQQEELSHQAPVFKPNAKRPVVVPDHDPPNGYICYRCGNKGHWIQQCPTNDDPEFDNRPRVKRTTGIPRSFLQKVDKSVVLAQSEGDEAKRPFGVMVNAEGDFVIAEPDKASWEQFQAKAKTSVAAKPAQAEDKEVRERGLECSIDKKMFIEPMKTPCCQRTFCNDCIINALIESDFVCPACQSEGVLIDDLQADEEAAQKLRDYLKEKQAAKDTATTTPPPASPKEQPTTTTTTATTEPAAPEKEETKDDNKVVETKDGQGKDKSPSPPAQPASVHSTVGTISSLTISENQDPKENQNTLAKPANAVSRKRPAEDFLENPRIPKGPRAMQNQQPQNMMSMPMGNMMFNNGMGMMGMPQGNMNMNMGMGMGMMNMPMNMGMNMPMNMPMMSMPMMNAQGFNNGYNAGWGMPTNNMGMQGWGMGNVNRGMGQGGNDGGEGEEDAYFRKPVNPHRHQNKQRRVRPSDYREL